MEILTGIAGPVLAFVLLVVPLIVVHELGHLLVGRLFGVKADAFSVGGTLNVGGSQAAGAYAGTFTVTVNYQ